MTVTVSDTWCVIDPDVPMTFTVYVLAGVAAVVVIARAEVPEAFATDAGAKPQLAPAGRPLHVSATAPLNPPSGVNVMVDVVEPPEAMAAGESAEAEI